MGLVSFQASTLAAVQLEGLAPALPVYSDLSASGAHLHTLVRWLCVVVPLRGDSEVYVARRAWLWRGRLRAVGVASPRSPRGGRGWLYNPKLGLALPPPVDRSPDLTDLLRGTLCGQACLAQRCNQRELPSTRARDLLPERRVSTARCTAVLVGLVLHLVKIKIG